MLEFWIVFLVIVNLIHFLGTWNLYKLAGRKWWEAAIPVYNFLIALKIINRPWWWIFIMVIPIIGPILIFVILAEIGISFGKKSSNQIVLTVFSLGFYLYYLNYIEKPNYKKIENRKETFISSIIFAVIVATFIHVFAIQPYTIPTQSMEKTLQVGDFIFVSKLNYGLRIPTTPIGLPFLQSAIPFLNTKSYIDKVRLPLIKLPALEKVKRNDIVVFNFPADSIHTAIDRKDPYVKRCVGMPGDSLKITNGILYINNKIHNLPANSDKQYAYLVVTDIKLSESIIEKKFDYLEYDFIGENEDGFNYIIYLTNENLEKIKEFSSLKKVERLIAKESETIKHIRPDNSIDSVNSIFPVDKNWNLDHYGSLYIPKKGDVINLTKDNINQLYHVITKYEHNSLKITNNAFIINGKATKKYKVLQNYYFMMGDNRYRSLDSRFFGFVPEDHIFGKPLFRWLSIEWRIKSGFLPFKLRLEKMMMSVEQANIAKTKSYLWYVITGLILYFGIEYLVKRRKK